SKYDCGGIISLTNHMNYISGLYSFFFFFFQAEDGIRDYKVTGVQTCALPILTLIVAFAVLLPLSAGVSQGPEAPKPPPGWETKRSEERRVGKECRYRWGPYH